MNMKHDILAILFCISISALVISIIAFTRKSKHEKFINSPQVPAYLYPCQGSYDQNKYKTCPPRDTANLECGPKSCWRYGTIYSPAYPWGCFCDDGKISFKECTSSAPYGYPGVWCGPTPSPAPGPTLKTH